jgi:PAS domain S-box-containing protein
VAPAHAVCFDARRTVVLVREVPRIANVAERKWSGAEHPIAPRLPEITAAVTLGVALIVLIGWATSADALTRLVPGGGRMVPATALSFLLSALALWFSARAQRHRLLQLASAWLIVFMGAGRLLAYALGTPHVDFLLFNGSADAAGSVGRMSPATALNFLLLGSALLLVHRRGAARIFQVLVILVLLIGWLGFTRYVYGGEPLIAYAAMAIHTAILFMLLALTLLTLRRDAPLMMLLVGEDAGAISARRLLPAALILPLVIGWMPALAERAGWLSAEAGLALVGLVSVALFGAIVWRNALYLRSTDQARRAELNAREASDQRMRLIIENALDAVVSIDEHGVITDWNPRAERLFGWSRHQAIGVALAELLIPERYRAAHLEGLRRVQTGGEPRVLNRRVELSALHRQGHEFPIELTITPIREASGLRFSAFVRDISERQRADAQLRASEQRLKTLAESLPNLVWTCRSDGWCDYLSRQWVEYTGCPEAEQLGSGWAEHLHPEDRPHVERAWREAVETGRAYDVEFRIRRHDGVYRWFKTRAIPLHDAAGRIVKWFGSNTDVEESKRAEEKLRIQLARLGLLDRITRAIGERQDAHSILRVVVQQLVDHLPIDFGCVVLKDNTPDELKASCIGAQDARITQALEIGEGTTIAVGTNGLRRSLEGRLVHEPDLANVPFDFAQRLMRGGLGSLVLAPLLVESTVFGVLVAARTGLNRFSSADCEFLRQLSEHVALAWHQAQLYGELQRTYEDLRLSQARLMQEERLRALGQMASGIAHDINNALSPAALYVESLVERDPSLSSQARQYLGIVQRAIEDVANTVSRMKEFYRRSDAQAYAPVDVNRTVEQVIALTEARWSTMPQERGTVIEVRKDLAPDLPFIVGLDSELRDALTNLILNAVDAMGERGGTLTLRTRAHGELVHIEVSDTGVGMDEATRLRCLEPFFTTKGERGTGLGLAMVYGMLSRHHGDIEIDSTPGQGTTIRLSFAALVDVDFTTTGVYHAPGSMRAQRLLLIDDDPIVLGALSEILRHEGHAVAIARGGAEGIAAFEAADKDGMPFSAVITDLGMPHVDGRKVAAAIKASRPGVPVLLLTGWGYRMQDEALPEHIDRILSKPPKVAELRRALMDLQR